ncbi:hypothetical protein SAMN05192589_12327 [Paracidovorax valerianellae]|uniref:Uncharacterized protein n=1 Tax=Paracidovorax valerianellae TaxID=187868 RepID=A0A1G7EHI2_9BURK|nr:hypothetical protein SAMN05192589_12327 [Paracidovorax valerianellae]
MGLCFSTSSGSSSRRGSNVDSTRNSSATTDRSAQERTASQAGSHLSDLSRSRSGLSNAETVAFQRQRTAVLSSARRLTLSEAKAAVTDVLKLVRDTYYRPNLKSGNKVHGDGGPEEAVRQERATLEVERIRAQADPLKAAMEGEAHQCQELALLAMHHLQERGLNAQILELGGDDEGVAHDVAIIGPAPNPLPADMKNWPADVYVCDPWSNIACSAKDYPKEFTSKMKKWEDAGKLVGYQPKGFVLPTDRQWVNDVLHGEKMI